MIIKLLIILIIINNNKQINKNDNHLKNIGQIEEMKIKPNGWKKDTASYKINKAIQDNKNRKE